MISAMHGKLIDHFYDLCEFDHMDEDSLSVSLAIR